MKSPPVSAMFTAALLTFLPSVSCILWPWQNPVDGQWSSWTAWSSCQNISSRESFPFRFKQRSCSNPAPKHGGAYCKGESRRLSPCVDCNLPLGLENGRVSNSSITASHSHKDFPASSARLNGKSAWCSMNPKGTYLYLQIDLGKMTSVTAIASQGYYPPEEEMSLRLGRVSKYELMYSTSGRSWHLYNDSENKTVLRGNAKRNGTVLNILSPEITARFIRVYPISYFTFVCMRLELYGCAFACGTALGAEPGSIMTKSSPLMDQDCLWHVHVPNITSLNMDFINFNLPCSNGFAEFRDGGMPYSSAKVLAHYCGVDSLPPLISATSGQLWVRFKSNASSPQVGFYSIYFPGCGGNVDGSSGEIKSPNFPNEYFHNSKCTWTITVPERKSVHLKFIKFEIEGDINRRRCPHDALSVWNSSDSDGALIGKYCNSNPPPSEICNAGNTMRIKFHSDDALAYGGFFIMFRAVDPLSPCNELSSIITSTPSRISTMVQMSPTPSISSQTVFAQEPILRMSDRLLGLATKTSAMGPPTKTSAMKQILMPFSTSVVINKTFSFPGVSLNDDLRAVAQKAQKDDGEDDGLWSVVILSILSFVVLCMIVASIIPSVKKHYETQKLEKEMNSLVTTPMLALCTNSREGIQGGQGCVRESSACEDEASMQSIDAAQNESIPEKPEADQMLAASAKCSCSVEEVDGLEEGHAEKDVYILNDDDDDSDGDSGSNTPEISSLKMSNDDLASSFAQEMQQMLGQFLKDDMQQGWDLDVLSTPRQSLESQPIADKNIPQDDLSVQEKRKMSPNNLRSKTDEPHCNHPNSDETSI